MLNVIDKVVGKNIPNPIAKDSDRDGVMDIIDCQPFNPRKQGVLHNIGASVARKFGREELADKIKTRGDQLDEDRAEVRQAERTAFQKERLTVAKQRGTRRARGGTSFGSFVKDIRGSTSLRQTTTTGRKKTKFVKVKGKPGQFRKITVGSGTTTAPRQKNIRDVLGGNIPKFF